MIIQEKQYLIMCEKLNWLSYMHMNLSSYKIYG